LVESPGSAVAVVDVAPHDEERGVMGSWVVSLALGRWKRAK
jgi:hypothetical protein